MKQSKRELAKPTEYEIFKKYKARTAKANRICYHLAYSIIFSPMVILHKRYPS
jgi:hypothetical protein